MAVEEVLLSIITVTSNDTDRLKETISSLNPIYEDKRFEHVIVDGGTSNSTCEFIASYDVVSNLVYIRGRDEGIYDAMNRGGARVSGRFVWFLNCGDTLALEKNLLLEEILKLPDSCEPEIICFPFLEKLPTGSTEFKSVGKVCLSRLPTSHQGMLFSRGFLLSQKYNKNYKIAGDYDLYLRSDKGKVVPLFSAPALVQVERYGVASANPVKSYSEYLISAYNNISGPKLVYTCALIFLKMTVVLFYKKFWKIKT